MRGCRIGEMTFQSRRRYQVRIDATPRRLRLGERRDETSAAWGLLILHSDTWNISKQQAAHSHIRTLGQIAVARRRSLVPSYTPLGRDSALSRYLYRSIDRFSSL